MKKEEISVDVAGVVQMQERISYPSPFKTTGELIDNAIDAKASKITIEAIKSDGKKEIDRIIISDNGTGVKGEIKDVFRTGASTKGMSDGQIGGFGCGVKQAIGSLTRANGGARMVTKLPDGQIKYAEYRPSDCAKHGKFYVLVGEDNDISSEDCTRLLNRLKNYASGTVLEIFDVDISSHKNCTRSGDFYKALNDEIIFTYSHKLQQEEDLTFIIGDNEYVVKNKNAHDFLNLDEEETVFLIGDAGFGWAHFPQYGLSVRMSWTPGQQTYGPKGSKSCTGMSGYIKTTSFWKDGRRIELDRKFLSEMFTGLQYVSQLHLEIDFKDSLFSSASDESSEASIPVARIKQDSTKTRVNTNEDFNKIIKEICQEAIMEVQASSSKRDSVKSADKNLEGTIKELASSAGHVFKPTKKKAASKPPDDSGETQPDDSLESAEDGSEKTSVVGTVDTNPGLTPEGRRTAASSWEITLKSFDSASDKNKLRAVHERIGAGVFRLDINVNHPQWASCTSPTAFGCAEQYIIDRLAEAMALEHLSKKYRIMEENGFLEDVSYEKTMSDFTELTDTYAGSLTKEYKKSKSKRFDILNLPAVSEKNKKSGASQSLLN